MLTSKQLSLMIRDTFRRHSVFPREPKLAFRFDGITPAGTHPVLLALLTLQEELLPEETRVLGVKVLLAHDLLEDTTGGLTIWIWEDPEAEQLVHELTIPPEKDKYVEFWRMSEKAKLFAFYDNVSGLMATSRVKPERLTFKRAQVREEMLYIAEKWGQLEIVKIARGLLGK